MKEVKQSIKIITTSYIYHYSNFDNYSFQVYNEFANLKIFKKVIRKLLFSILPTSIWYGKWKKDIKEGDVLIVHASNFSEQIIDYLNLNFANIRIIHWFWNPVSVLNKIEFKDNNSELWSFDKNDCEKFDMKYNTTHYFRFPVDTTLVNKGDVIFIGYDKGRRSFLEELQTIFNKKYIKTKFIILEKGDKNIPYYDVLRYILEFSVILDILQDGQQGNSLRPMESIFFRKKLVTNDRRIVDMDFYSSENIFVLGMDNIDMLYSFIKQPYVEIDKSIVEKYDFDNWVNRFFI